MKTPFALVLAILLAAFPAWADLPYPLVCPTPYPCPATPVTRGTIGALTKTFTNTTYDTAGSGNVFKINGTAISAVTGTGAVALAGAPTFTGSVDAGVNGGTGGSLVLHGSTSGSASISTEAASLGIKFDGTNALTLPTGTTAQRPSATAGMLRFNSTKSLPEVYSGTSWKPMSGVALVAQGGTGWTNTGVDTNEKNLVVVTMPPLSANASVTIDALWSNGYASNAANIRRHRIRISSSACTPGSTCTSGTSVWETGANSSSTVGLRNQTKIWSKNSTSSQVFFSALDIDGFGNASSVASTAAIDFSAAWYINFDCATETDSADNCKLDAYSVQVSEP